MSTPTPKRLVIDLPDHDHRAIKSTVAESGESISSFVKQAIEAELRRRARLLNRTPDTEAPQCL